MVHAAPLAPQNRGRKRRPNSGFRETARPSAPTKTCRCRRKPSSRSHAETGPAKTRHNRRTGRGGSRRPPHFDPGRFGQPHQFSAPPVVLPSVHTKIGEQPRHALAVLKRRQMIVLGPAPDGFDLAAYLIAEIIGLALCRVDGLLLGPTGEDCFPMRDWPVIGTLGIGEGGEDGHGAKPAISLAIARHAF